MTQEQQKLYEAIQDAKETPQEKAFLDETEKWIEQELQRLRSMKGE